MEDLTKHYLISGRVQGVGYRAFAQRTALGFKLKGWVRNLNDGRVEVMAQGKANTLQAFENQLREGPMHGRVDTMIVEEWKSPDVLSDFEVRKDGP
jgi:acylphosphatase